MEEKKYDGVVGAEKAKKVKPLTMISGIFGVLIGVALLALAFFVAYTMISSLFIKDSATIGEALFLGFFGWILGLLALAVAGFVFVVAIFNIVSGALAISASVGDDKKYMAKKGLIITSIVFDFILTFALGVFALSTMGGKSSGDEIFTILLGVGAGAALLSAVVKIVDVSKVSKRYKLQTKFEKEQKKIEEEHGTENKLAKYKEMLDNGVITKEEYEKLRAKELGLDKE